MEKKARESLIERRALLADAERAEMQAVDNHRRAWEQALNGEITPAEWREDWKPQLEKAKQDTLRRVGILTEAVEVAAGEVEAISALAESAAVNALAAVKSEIAGEIRSAEGVEGLRAALGLLFERVEIVRTPIDSPPLTGDGGRDC